MNWKELLKPTREIFTFLIGVLVMDVIFFSFYNYSSCGMCPDPISSFTGLIFITDLSFIIFYLILWVYSKVKKK